MIPRKIHFILKELPNALEQTWINCSISNNMSFDYNIWHIDKFFKEYDIPDQITKEYPYILDYMKFRILYDEGGICTEPNIIIGDFSDKLNYKCIGTLEDAWYVSNDIIASVKKSVLLFDCISALVNDTYTNKTYNMMLLKRFGKLGITYPENGKIRNTHNFIALRCPLIPCTLIDIQTLDVMRVYDNYTSNIDITLNVQEL